MNDHVRSLHTVLSRTGTYFITRAPCWRRSLGARRVPDAALPVGTRMTATRS